MTSSSSVVLISKQISHNENLFVIMNVDGPSYYSVSNLLCDKFFKQNKEKKKQQKKTQPKTSKTERREN